MAWVERLAGDSAADRPSPIDIGLAVLAAAIAVASVAQSSDAHGSAWPAWTYLLAVGTAVALPWRRITPFTCAVVTGGFTVAFTLFAHAAQPVLPLAILVAIYAVAARAKDWQRALALVAVVSADVLLTHTLTGALLSLLGSVGAFILGSVVRDLRRVAVEQSERAAQLGRESTARQRQATSDERARIAREMHDILAHAVSLMVVQAEAGPVVVRADPARAEEIFDAIAGAGREAMSQLRRTLSVLKREDDVSGLLPQPHLGDVAGLVGRVRDAGLDVELRMATSGQVRQSEVPADVQAAAYRIVQEALTNAVKHAGCSHVSASVEIADGILRLAIVDDGHGATPTVSDGVAGQLRRGRGLIGISERAVACGGSTRIGPRSSGPGFEVRADLPITARNG